MFYKKEGGREAFQEKLLLWFRGAARDLPWRKLYTPYQVWISEIMGQQTRMDRVAEYFARWIKKFPTVESVAAADEIDILKSWEGLGYYTRARNIKRAAEQILRDHDGLIPDTYEHLLLLPGIGPYTAGAIMSIGFNQPFVVIDANVERVFARLEDISAPIKQAKTRKAVRRMAEELLWLESPRNWNEALMEFGALICTPKNPQCGACPVQMYCKAYKADTQYVRPLPTKKNAIIDISMACCILCRNDKVFIQQRLQDDLWGGLWEFPGGSLDNGESPEEAAAREVAEETGWKVAEIAHFQTVIHHYTRYRVTLHGFLGTLPESYVPPVLHAADDGRWVNLDELSEYPYPAGHRQLVNLLVSIGIPEF